MKPSRRIQIQLKALFPGMEIDLLSIRRESKDGYKWTALGTRPGDGFLRFHCKDTMAECVRHGIGVMYIDDCRVYLEAKPIAQMPVSENS